MNIIIDTNILINSFNEAEPGCMRVIYFINKDNPVKIVLDTQDNRNHTVLQKEYFQNLGQNKFFQKWFNELHHHHLIFYASGKLDAEIKNGLLKRGFHEITDQTLVALALKTDRCIITEDCDFGKGNETRANTPEKQEILRYMTHELALKILDSGEGFIFLQKNV